jgi:hypothetical protein
MSPFFCSASRSVLSNLTIPVPIPAHVACALSRDVLPSPIVTLNAQMQRGRTLPSPPLFHFHKSDLISPSSSSPRNQYTLQMDLPLPLFKHQRHTTPVMAHPHSRWDLRPCPGLYLYLPRPVPTAHRDPLLPVHGDRGRLQEAHRVRSLGGAGEVINLSVWGSDLHAWVPFVHALLAWFLANLMRACRRQEPETKLRARCIVSWFKHTHSL